MYYKDLSGQSAIEYLMTYGWMLLVVAVVGGAVFSVAQDQSMDSVSGFSGGDVLIDNFGVTSSDELGLEVRSGSGNGITVSHVNISDSSTGNWVYKEFTEENRVAVGSSRIFELPNVSRSSSGNDLDVEIVYDSGGLSNMTVSGTIGGNLELTDTGSYEGLPEDDHESINGENGGSLTLLDTVNYTYDDSGDVQVNESTAGGDGYQVDLNNDFSEEVEEVRIVEMHGADGGDGENRAGGSGGFIENSRFNVESFNSLDLWIGEAGINDGIGGFGRSDGGDSLTSNAGSGGGSTEIWTDSNTEFIAAADAGGGGGDYMYPEDAGGGARNGTGDGGEDAEHVDPKGPDPSGGDGVGTAEGEDGGQVITSDTAIRLEAGEQSKGGSTEGHGWILIEYYG